MIKTHNTQRLQETAASSWSQINMEKEKEVVDSSISDSDERVSVINYNYRGIKVMPYIIGNETFEKLGVIGTSANLMVYLTTIFNMKSVEAATLVSIFSGTSNMAPLLGAFLSDSFLGRYKTLAFASISTLLGLTMLMLTAAISKLHPPQCSPNQLGSCVGPSNYQYAFLLCGFGFLVIGAGGIRPCNLAFGADQFDPATESGKSRINSFFNWYYFTFTFAVMVAVTAIVYVQSSVSWTVGLGIPACLMLVACALFFWGSKLYVKVEPQGSPLTGVAQVMVAAARKRRLKSSDRLFNFTPADSINYKLPWTNQFRFLDKAAIITTEDQINTDGSAANPWRLCSTQQVEEIKCLLRIIPIWASAIVGHVGLVQPYAVFQALQSDRHLLGHFQVPAASYIVVSMLALTIWIPIYDRIVVPFLRKITGKQGGITLLQRMGIGLALSFFTMLASALVEGRRRNAALRKPTLGISQRGGAVSSMSASWLIPQLIIAGLSEGFNSIGQIEFYYRESPENMRSVAGSLFFCGMAGSSYLSGFLISVVHHMTATASTSVEGGWLNEDLNKGKLDYFYYMIAGLGVVNFGYFLLCARWYRYKGTGSSSSSLEMPPIETKQPEKHLV